MNKVKAIGIDLGNGYTKIGNNTRFASKVMKGKMSKLNQSIKHNKEQYEIILDGETWVIGKGNSYIGSFRYFTKEYKMSLLTAIALSTGLVDGGFADVGLVLGVPVADYNNLSEKIKAEVLGYGTQNITVAGKHFTINICDVTIFVEGALPIKDNDNSHVITVDIGEGTVNMIEWKNQEMVNKATKTGSFKEMYSEIATYLKDEFGEDVAIEDVRELMGKITMNTLDGKQVNITGMYDIVRGTINELVSTTAQGFNFGRADKVKIFGGGAEDTFKYWKELIPKAELVENFQYVNQEVYQAVAEVIYE